MNPQTFYVDSKLSSVDQVNTHISARKYFFIFCLLHLIFWTLIPTLLYPNPPTDTVESIAWGNLWLLGYEKHPFLAAWLSAAFTKLGGSVGWPVYLLSQLSVVTCFYAVWCIAKKILSPWAALIAVVLLEGVSYYNLASTSFNPNVLMLPLWALASLFFYNAITEQKIKWWIGLGIFCGLAMLAKYEAVILYAVMLITLLTTQQGRVAFKQSGFYLAIILGFLIFLPNLIWLVKHNFDAFLYAGKELATTRMNGIPKFIEIFCNPAYFLIEQVIAILPALFLFTVFFKFWKVKLQFNTQTTNATQQEFNRKFLIIFGLGPLVLTLIFSLLTGSSLVSRWAFPFFSLTSLLAVAYFQPVITAQRLKLFGLLVVLWNVLMLLGNIYIFKIQPYTMHQVNHYEFFPGKAVAATLTQQWQDYYHKSLPYVAGTHDVVVNVSAFSQDKPIPFFDWNINASPWINMEKMQQEGAVFVIAVQDDVLRQQAAAAITLQYPQLEHAGVQTFNWQTGANIMPVKLWVAFLPPQKIERI